MKNEQLKSDIMAYLDSLIEPQGLPYNVFIKVVSNNSDYTFNDLDLALHELIEEGQLSKKGSGSNVKNWFFSKL